MGAKLFMASDHGNKKELHHLAKVILMWNTKYNCVKRITLDTDASGGTSDDTADGINVSLLKLETDTKIVLLNGQHGNAGGGETGDFLMEGLQTRNRIHIIAEYL